MAKKIFDYRDFAPIIVAGKRYLPQQVCKTASEARDVVARLKKAGWNKTKVNKREYNVGVRYLVYFLPLRTSR